MPKKAYVPKPNIEELKASKTNTLINVLGQLEVTIRHLSTLYANPEITTDKKKEFERMIREAETRSMAILTILRNRK